MVGFTISIEQVIETIYKESVLSLQFTSMSITNLTRPYLLSKNQWVNLLKENKRKHWITLDDLRKIYEFIRQEKYHKYRVIWTEKLIIYELSTRNIAIVSTVSVICINKPMI